MVLKNLFSKRNYCTFFNRYQIKREIPVNDWNCKLNQLEGALSDLLSGSEEEFLSIGAQLQNFALRARKISQLSSSLSHLTSSDTITFGIDSLQTQLNKMSLYIEPDSENSGSGIEKLKNTLNIIRSLNDMCVNFNRVTRMLNVLSISMKVESVEVAQNTADFNTVAQNVKRLADLIDANSENVISQSESLTSMVYDSIKKTMELSRKQKETTLDILKETQSSLESLTDLNKKSVEVSYEIEEDSSSICKSTGEVVSSLQFHDITRQEIEHTQETIKLMREKLDGFIENRDTLVANQKSKTTGWVSTVCEIKSSQLNKTKEQLQNAVQDIIKNIHGISKNVKFMVKHALTLTGESNQSGSSLLEKVGTGITTVIQSLHENDKTKNEIAESVNGAISAISQIVDKISKIGFEIKLVALNAQVKSICAGEKGNSFGVLAEEIQKLSSYTRGETDKVQNKLETTIGNKGSQNSQIELDNQIKLDDQISNDIESSTNNLQNLLSSLNNINKDFTDLINKVTMNGTTLSEDIDKYLNTIVFQKNMCKSIDDVVTGLTEIVQKYKEVFPNDVTHSEKDLETLKAQYTTDSERRVHELITGQVLIHGTNNQPTSNEEADFNLDNIFFDDVDVNEVTDDNENVELFETEESKNVELFESEEKKKEVKKCKKNKEEDFGDNVDLF